MGCLVDISGQTFGELTVLHRVENSRDHKARWRCRCSCGKEVDVSGKDLRSGHTKSCGYKMRAFVSASKITHGDTIGDDIPRLYKIWSGMRCRCGSSKYRGYRWYGAKGIKVCPEWQTSYVAFRDWALANGYEDNLTIDRIDVAGDYEPSNCRWVTQSENSSLAHRLAPELEEKIRRLLGESVPAKEIARETGVSVSAVYNVRKRMGIPSRNRARHTAAMREIVKGLWSVGASPAIIRKAMGFSLKAIRKYINEFTREAESAAS